LKQFQKITWKVVNVVSPPTKTQRITRNAVVSRVILKEFIEAALIMDNKGFFAGTCGEVSLRTSGGKFIITLREIPICRLNEESILVETIEKEIDAKNENLPLHIQWHRAVYNNSNANAVVLCQLPWATVLANRMQKPKQDILMDANKLLDSVDMANLENINLNNKLDEEHTFFIQSVGILAWGQSLNDLINRMEILERLSEISAREKLIH
ncbi:MAG: class II aldolase/adducin family protein, partial [Anaerolineaceae bacterium]